MGVRAVLCGGLPPWPPRPLPRLGGLPGVTVRSSSRDLSRDAETGHIVEDMNKTRLKASVKSGNPPLLLCLLSLFPPMTDTFMTLHNFLTNLQAAVG